MVLGFREGCRDEGVAHGLRGTDVGVVCSRVRHPRGSQALWWESEGHQGLVTAMANFGQTKFGQNQVCPKPNLAKPSLAKTKFGPTKLARPSSAKKCCPPLTPMTFQNVPRTLKP